MSRVCSRTCIPAYHCMQVPMSSLFSQGEEWLIEHLLVMTPDASALGAPTTLVRIGIDGKAVVPVANFTPIGKPLGIAQDPHTWLDKLDLDSGRREKEQEKFGALICNIADQNF